MSSENGAFNIRDITAEIEEARREREARDRTFTLAGEQFTHRPGVPLETIAVYLDMALGETPATSMEAIAIMDQTVLAFLDPGQEDKWWKVRGRTGEVEHPITHGDITKLLEGLVRTLSARPTESSSDSTAGDASSTTTSTENSPLQEQAT